MKIGVPKEIKDNENRIAATPAGVHALAAAGHEVMVQAGGVGTLGLQEFVVLLQLLEPSASLNLGKLPQPVLLHTQVEFFLAALDQLDQITVGRFRPQASFSPFAAEEGQALTDGRRCVTATEPGPQFTLCIVRFQFESGKAGIQDRACQCLARQGIATPLTGMLGMELLDERLVGLRIGTGLT